MPFVLSFDPGSSASSMSAAQYDEVIERLQAAGAGNPKGRLYHVCYGEPGNLRVTDVWDTLENFQAFGQTLMPILQKLGVNPGSPTPIQTHNIIIGS